MVDHDENGNAVSDDGERETEEARGAKSPSNFLSWLWNLTAMKAEERAYKLYGDAEDYAVVTFNMLTRSILVSVVLLVAGMLFGGIGNALEWSPLLAFGTFLLKLCGLVAAVGLTVFWLLSGGAALVIMAATRTGNTLFSKYVPALTLDQANAVLRWLRGITVWITFAGLYAATVPVWRDPSMTMNVAIAGLVLAGIMSARWWTESKLPRIAVAVYATIALVYATLTLAVPDTMAGIGTTIDDATAEFVDWHNDRRAVNAIEEIAETAAQSRDNALYGKLIAERQQIRQRAAEHSGRYASEEDQRRDHELGVEIARLQNGTFWEHTTTASSSTPKKEAAEKKAVSTEASSASAGTASKPTQSSSSVHRSEEPAKKKPLRLSRKESEEIFKELGNYPDL